MDRCGSSEKSFGRKSSCSFLELSDDEDLEPPACIEPAAPCEKLSLNAIDVNCKPVSYACLSITAVESEALETIQEAAQILGLEPDVAEFCLRRYQWHFYKLVEDWLDSREKIYQKMKVAIDLPGSESQVAPKTQDCTKIFLCPVTAEEVPLKDTDALLCGHRFSKTCWKQYLTASINSEATAAVLSKLCPSFQCQYLVSQMFWKKYLSRELFEKYRRFRHISFVEANWQLQWCPNPKCSLILKRLSPYADEQEPLSVTCNCGTSFCITCGEEPHLQIPCDIIRQWNIKNESEAENIAWVFVHTKSCPNCNCPIEKNQGCMHMTCRCGHEFCWVCLTPWKPITNWSHNCNVYQASNDADEESKMREHARTSLERYTHYYTRFQAHHQAQQITLQQQLPKTQSQLHQLSQQLGLYCQGDFLQDAVMQVVECRRMLKWSYSFGYFVDWIGAENLKNLFEDHQGELEKNLERLQELTETFDPIKYSQTNVQELLFLRMQLCDLTRVVRIFSEKITKAFQTDFVPYYYKNKQYSNNIENVSKLLSEKVQSFMIKNNLKRN